MFYTPPTKMSNMIAYVQFVLTKIQFLYLR